MNRLLQNGIGATPENLEGAYLPFPAATEFGKLNPDKVTLHPIQEAAADVQRGFIPPQGGIVEFNNRKGIGAFDLVGVRQVGRDQHGRDVFEITPISKDAVCNDTDKIQAEGGLVLHTPDGLYKIFGAALQARRDWTRHHIGGVSIQNFGLESVVLETVKIDSNIDSGKIIARTINRIHGGF